jgi:hypothetical protein
MPRVGFKHMIPMFEQSRPIHALEHTATVIEICFLIKKFEIVGMFTCSSRTDTPISTKLARLFLETRKTI